MTPPELLMLKVVVRVVPSQLEMSSLLAPPNPPVKYAMTLSPSPGVTFQPKLNPLDTGEPESPEMVGVFEKREVQAVGPAPPLTFRPELTVVVPLIVAPVKVGFVLRTTEPVPVDVVTPVPPLRTGRAVPDKPMVKVPDEVIGEPETLRKDGTVAETEVTVPVPGAEGVCQERVPEPLVVRTWPLVPWIVG